jgi:hypothetical protein
MLKVIAVLLAALVGLLGLAVFQNIRSASAPVFKTPYQAVVLTGGQVYYGKLENASGMYPVLRDIFYVVTKQDAQTKQVSNVLVRRGKELHGPEYMVLNRQSILFVEPVKEDSEIGKSIEEQRSQSK